MGRPAERTVQYFPHYIGGDTMEYIEEKYGNDGYAIWYKIIEKLCESNDHHFCLEDDRKMFVFAHKRCRVSTDKFIEVVNELVSFGKINKQLWEEKRIVFSERFIESVQPVYKTRTYDCVTTDELLEKYLNYEIEKSLNGIEQTECKDVQIQQETNVENSYLQENPGFLQENPGFLQYPPIEVHEVEVEVEKDTHVQIENLHECDSENDFEKFWNQYDKKRNRKKCQAKWKRIPEKDKKKIFECLPAYIKSTPDIQYRMNPSTWLNGECWNDEIIDNLKVPNKSRGSPAIQYRPPILTAKDFDYG